MGMGIIFCRGSGGESMQSGQLGYTYNFRYIVLPGWKLGCFGRRQMHNFSCNRENLAAGVFVFCMRPVSITAIK